MAPGSENFSISANLTGGKQVEQGISAIGDAAEKTTRQVDALNASMSKPRAVGMNQAELFPGIEDAFLWLKEEPKAVSALRNTATAMAQVGVATTGTTQQVAHFNDTMLRFAGPDDVEDTFLRFAQGGEVLADLGQTATRTGGRVKQALGEAETGTGKMVRDFALMERAGATGLRNLAGGLGLVATSAAAAGLAIGGVVAAARKVTELGKLGGESLTVKTSFDLMMRSVGVATSELQEMQTAAEGTISTLKLLELANYSVIGVTGQVGQAIGQANDQLITIARAAFKARPSLQSVEFAYQSLVDGIKRVEKRLVDNLGLQVKVREANERYAASVGKSVNELTAEEVQLAFLNEVLRAGNTLVGQVGGTVDTMNDAFSRAEASATNLKVAIGEKLAPAVTSAVNAWAAFLDMLSQPLLSDQDQATYQIKILKDEITALTFAYAKAKKEALLDPDGQAAANVDILAAELRKARAELQRLENAALAGEMATDNAARVAREYATDTGLLDAAIRRITEAFGGYVGVIRELYDAEMTIIGVAQKAFDKTLQSTVRSMASLGAGFGDALAAGNKYASMTAQLEFLHEKGLITEEQYAYQLGVIDKQLGDLKDTYKGTTGAAKEFHDEWADAISSMVSSELSPSFTVEGLAPELSVREDEVDEHYRRLAAIAIRGQEEIDKHQADWADTLALIPEDVKAQGIEAMQAWAKDKVLAYDKGLDFSLINRDALKKRIMEALLSQEMKKQLVDEITAELGGAVSEAEVSAAASQVLGGTPLGQITLGGVTFGTSETPPDMSAVAGQISTELNAAFRDEFDATEMLRMTAQAITSADKKPVEEASKVVGTTMVSGIAGAVEKAAPDIVNRLAVAIAPSVARILAEQDRRRGVYQ